MLSQMIGKLQNVNMSQESAINIGAVTEGESSRVHIVGKSTYYCKVNSVGMIYEAMLTLFHFILMRTK